MSFFDQDLGVARISEDLIALLIDKGLISFNDFPEVARKKIIDRWASRSLFPGPMANPQADTGETE